MRRLIVLVTMLGCGGSSSPGLTNGDVCELLSGSTCSRLQSCGKLTGSLAVCEATLVQSCCTRINCQAESKNVTQEDITACSTALTSWDCEALLKGTFPVACVTGQ